MAITPEQAEQIRQKLLEQVAKMPVDQQEALKQQVTAATPEQLEAYLKPAEGAEGSGGCLFCGIAAGKIDTVKVYEDEKIVAFLDITPAAAGQVIIAPKEHFQFIFQIPDQIVWDMFRVLKLLTPLVINITSAKGMSTYFAQGQAAGQMMEHFSINMIPRFEGDKSVFAWDRKQIDQAELKKVGAELGNGVQKILAEEKEKIEVVVRERAAQEEAKKPENLPHYPEKEV